jgi:hypothetical protein
MPFMAKILRILQFEQQHPELTRVVGAFWSDDNGMFVSNAQILSVFLGIKCNSINANFREHDFTPPKSVPLERLCRLRISLKGSAAFERHIWKQRKHQTATFKRTTTLEEAARLSARSWSVFRAQPVRSLVLDDPSNDQALEEWSRHFRLHESAAMDSLLHAFIPQRDGDDLKYVQQLHQNFSHLCSLWRDPESLMGGTVSITAFISFFRCFGAPTGVREQIEEITVSDPQAISATAPGFIDGVCIGFGKAQLGERWAEASPESWALIEGEEEGTFRLLTRSRQIDNNQDRCRTIWIDTTRQEERIGFKKDEDGEIIHVPNVAALLASLGLIKYAGLQMVNEDFIRQAARPLERRRHRIDPETLAFPNAGTILEVHKG